MLGSLAMVCLKWLSYPDPNERFGGCVGAKIVLGILKDEEHHPLRLGERTEVRTTNGEGAD